MSKDVSPIPIAQYFSGESIFITGGTGLMGKVLIEKLLRSCPDLDKIYLLIRPKKQNTVEERWKEMTNVPLFDILKSSNPDALKKIIPIPGDAIEENLGMSTENIKILNENVTIFIHMAAMIQFTDQLVEAFRCNTKATYVALELAKSFKKLKLFVHTSTAFSNTHIPCKEAIEKVLPAVQDWKVIIKLMETEPLAISQLKEKLLCGHPNPYTWSKSLAEQVVDDYKCYFPTIIMRPAIVGPCIFQPIVGWSDTLCGISAIGLPIGLGVMRVAFTDPESHQDYVPADIAINAMMVAAAKRLKTSDIGRTDVYNCGLNSELPVTSHHLSSLGVELLKKMPSKKAMWVPHVVFTTNELHFRLLFIILQVIPGLLMDGLLLLTFKKPVVLKVTKKFANVTRIFKKFSSGKLEFPNDRFQELKKFIPECDKDEYELGLRGYSVQKLFEIANKSNLQYFMKEDVSEETFRETRKNKYWLVILDKLIIYGFWAATAWCMFSYIKSSETAMKFISLL